MKNADVNRNEDKVQSTEGMPLRKMPLMISLKEAVELTGLSYRYLRELCLKKEIIHRRAGKKYFINYDKLVDYFNGEM